MRRVPICFKVSQEAVNTAPLTLRCLDNRRYLKESFTKHPVSAPNRWAQGMEGTVMDAAFGLTIGSFLPTVVFGSFFVLTIRELLLTSGGFLLTVEAFFQGHKRYPNELVRQRFRRTFG